MNNAGIVGEKRRRFTEEGLEVTMATNHYGHFLLTNMLGALNFKKKVFEKNIFYDIFFEKKKK